MKTKRNVKISFFFLFISLIICNTVSHIYNDKEFANVLNNIIIVFSRGYKNSELNAFFITMKKQIPCSYLLLISDSSTISYSKHFFNNGKIIGIELLNEYPYYPSNHSKYPISFEKLIEKIPIQINHKFNFFFHTIRFFLINVWMEKYGSLFKNILICDIKDIIFQNNPFNYIKKKGVYLQQEIYIRKNKVGIIADECNYEWIKPYNPTKNILIKPILNSGQILGTSKEIYSFISEFCSFMYETHLNTAEQGSMNYFIYSKNYKKNIIINFHGYGYALLLHYSLPRTKDNFTPFNNTIYNFDGSIPPIIHAYHLGLLFGSLNRKKKYRDYINYNIKQFN